MPLHTDMPKSRTNKREMADQLSEAQIEEVRQLVPPVISCELFYELTSCQAEPFRLFDLPPELWTRIIKKAVRKWRLIARLPVERRIDFGVPPLAKTCRAIRTETLKAYYKYNAFQAACTNDLSLYHDWISRMTQDHGSYVRRLKVAVYSCSGERQALDEMLRRRVLGREVRVREVSCRYKYGAGIRLFKVSVENIENAQEARLG